MPLRGVRRSSPQKPSAAASDWLSEAAVPPPASPRCPAALTAALAALPAFLFPAPPGVGGGGLSRLPPDATAPALSPDTLSIASDCSIVSDGASLASDSTFSLRRRRGLGRRRASAPELPPTHHVRPDLQGCAADDAAVGGGGGGGGGCCCEAADAARGGRLHGLEDGRAEAEAVEAAVMESEARLAQAQTVLSRHESRGAGGLAGGSGSGAPAPARVPHAADLDPASCI